MLAVVRTTLNIDDDVMAAARSLAAQRQEAVGKVVSDLARQALTRRVHVEHRSGVPLLPVEPGSRPVTMEMVNDMRDGDADG